MRLVFFKEIPLLSYKKSTLLQEFLVEISRNSQLNLLLLLSHPPTYTVGRSVKPGESPEKERLLKLGAEYIHSQRGGQITFHGPGQLVGYPIINLKEFNIGVREYVQNLEAMIQTVCQEFDIETMTTADTGVWIKNSPRKIAALGIQVQRHITSHGFALNCDTDLKWFDQIIPCALPGKSATSLSKESLREVTVTELTPKLIEAFGRQFNARMENLALSNSSLDREIELFCEKE
jgi:lipoate-protein ligase B